MHVYKGGRPPIANCVEWRKMSPLFWREKSEKSAKEVFTWAKMERSRSQGVQRYLKSNWFILLFSPPNGWDLYQAEIKMRGYSKRIKHTHTHTGIHACTGALSGCRLIELPDWWLLCIYPLAFGVMLGLNPNGLEVIALCLVSLTHLY